MSTYDTNIPGASGYAGAASLATNAYNNALARLNQKRMGTLRSYGYQADVDPTTGVLNNLRVDANNPYGQYQTMLRSHADAAQSAQDEALGRGLHGGLAHQLEDNTRYGFGADAANLGTSLQDTLTGYQDEQNSAAYDRDNALWQAQHQAELEAAAAGAFNTGDYSGNDYGDYSDPGTTDSSTATTPTAVSAAKAKKPPKSVVVTQKGVPASTKSKVVNKAAAAALAARSQGMNAKYGLGKKGGRK